MCFDNFWFGMFVFDVLGHNMLGITESSGVFGAFMRGVCFEFSAIGGAMLFDFLGFLLGELGFRGRLIFCSVEVRFLLSFFFVGRLFGFFFREFSFRCGANFRWLVLFEFGASREGVCMGVIRSFLVFCFG